VIGDVRRDTFEAASRASPTMLSERAVAAQVQSVRACEVSAWSVRQQRNRARTHGSRSTSGFSGKKGRRVPSKVDEGDEGRVVGSGDYCKRRSAGNVGGFQPPALKLGKRGDSHTRAAR
jgi:hypothetical protein